MMTQPMKPSKRNKRRVFTDEYKAEVVRLCAQPGKTVCSVARELGLTHSAVRNWVKQAKTDAQGGVVGALTSDERAELAKLRKEVRTLRQEREILKRAASFFAREGMS